MSASAPPKKPGIYLLGQEYESSLSLSSTHVIGVQEEYVVLEEGALVPGGAISLVSSEAMALFAQYGAIGILYGTLPGLGYPLFQVYLNLEGYQVAAFNILVNIAWSFKIFMGGLSDCVAIYGYRRKPWMILGWLVCLAGLIYLVCLSPGKPYCEARDDDNNCRSLINPNTEATSIRITLGTVVATFGTVYFLTIWDIVRNPWFYTGVTLTDEIPTGVRFIVSAFVATELADLGNEGAVYGMVTTVNNLAIPVSSVLYKYVDSHLDFNNTAFATESVGSDADKARVRWAVSYSYFISYAMKMLSLVWLFMLPPQKAHVQRLKRQGMVSPLAGRLTWALFLGLLAFSIVGNVASLFKDTSWWHIAGGNGVRPTPSPTSSSVVP
ncbi:hypothetical protein AaE_005495 [Aphanomyces astaci]|uniref:Uncharacterized protein n=1 Tax=Aphanomyces astaci TaxID=112090 RepID=A0A6A5AKQ1_APHAT|nr:hypothetical protein AaE_005495 [Aphanomyces astaci]